MDCLLESLAGVYITGMRYVSPQSLLPESDDDDTNGNLESCLANLHGRENELNDGIARLGKEALQCKRAGDMQGAKNCMQERRRYMKRVERLRSSSQLITSQLDLLRNQELDRELMHSLKLSANTLKKSGATLQVKTAEDVMSEFEEQFHEVNELSSVLSKPIMSDSMDFDFESELADLEAEVGIIVKKPVAATTNDISSVPAAASTPTFERPAALSHTFDRPAALSHTLDRPAALSHTLDRPVAVSNAFERPAPFQPVSLVTPVRGIGANTMVGA